jgi:hypothetical protein
MNITKKELAITMLMIIGLIVFYMMFIHTQLLFYIFFGCLTLGIVITWCIMVLDKK